MQLYGEETKKALKNFPWNVGLVHNEFILALAAIKKAAVLANKKTGILDKPITAALVKACDEILKGKHQDQFVLPGLQGGAGTGTNMNMNEVLARRATEISGDKIKIHPNNHANLSQSTNDVNPSALKVATYYLLENLTRQGSSLGRAFHLKAKEFKGVRKLGRTHLQDAVPTTLGAEFKTYGVILKKHLEEIERAKNICLTLNLGGTAIGNSVNATKTYVQEVYRELNKILRGKFKPAENFASLTSSQTDFLQISHVLTAMSADLSKIANDFRLLSSGPHGGLGEIILPELQNGSSIMPGKVNPVLPEAVNQMYFWVSGNNLAIEQAVVSAELELGVMLPIIATKLLESIKLVKEVIGQFDKLCVTKIKADKKKCLYHLENSTAYATLFVPDLGYDLVSQVVKRSISEKRSFKEVLLSEKHLSKKDFDKVLESFWKGK